MTPSGPAECPKEEEYLTSSVLMVGCVLKHAVTQLQQKQLKVLLRVVASIAYPLAWVWNRMGSAPSGRSGC